jgi:hypothetical protein
MKYRWMIVLLTLCLLVACAAPPAIDQPTEPPTSTASPTARPTARPTATVEPTEALTATPTDEPTPVTDFNGIGPDNYAEGVNPLTGLVVDDPSVLERSPLLIMVSNQSPEIRPQSGLSFADNVWEYQMEGFRHTRFTAVVYSQTPERVGSVRSVRMINLDHLRPMYDGLLVISGASTGVYQHLQFDGYWDEVFREEQGHDHLARVPGIPHPDTGFYHSLFAIPEKVWQYADERGVNNPPDLNGLAFTETVPDDGMSTEQVTIDYPHTGPIHRWLYDATLGQWLSFTTDLNAMTEEAQDFDALADAPLAFDNVVIIFAEYYLTDIIEDPGANLSSPGVTLTGEGDAVLLRDGQRFEIRWHRDPEDMIRFTDAAGDSAGFKPGQTWFIVVDTGDYPPEVLFR